MRRAVVLDHAAAGGRVPSVGPRGLLTVAYGRPKFGRWAADLARSLRLHSPGLPLAVVCDRDDPALERLFDYAVRPASFPATFTHKVALHRHAPFDRTLFVDADALAVRDVAFAFDLFDGLDVGLVGEELSAGSWHFDVAEMAARLGVATMPKFNGGLVCLRRGPAADSFFEDVAAVMRDYDAWGLRYVRSLKGGRSDEPCMSIAMARGTAGRYGVRDDGGRLMATPIGLGGRLRVDVVGGRGAFEKDGRVVDPAVVHFTSRTKHRDYFLARSRMRLDLAMRRLGRLGRAASLPAGHAAALAAAAYLRAARDLRRIGGAA